MFLQRNRVTQPSVMISIFCTTAPEGGEHVWKILLEVSWPRPEGGVHCLHHILLAMPSCKGCWEMQVRGLLNTDIGDNEQ